MYQVYFNVFYFAFEPRAQLGRRPTHAHDTTSHLSQRCRHTTTHHELFPQSFREAPKSFRPRLSVALNLERGFGIDSIAIRWSSWPASTKQRNQLLRGVTPTFSETLRPAQASPACFPDRHTAQISPRGGSAGVARGWDNMVTRFTSSVRTICVNQHMYSRRRACVCVWCARGIFFPSPRNTAEDAYCP